MINLRNLFFSAWLPIFCDIETLSEKLHDYFKLHSNPKFDLWNGGKAKSNVSSEAFWKQLWGEDWSCTY